MISKSTEEYLKNIYVLIKKNNHVRVTDLANKMNCSKPSVTKQLNILSKKGLIDYESYGEIHLTLEGENLAKRILADYDIIYILLNDVIGLDSELSSVEAAKIKSVISDETLNAFENFVNTSLGLNRLKCNFNIRKEECRECVIKRSVVNDRVN